MMHYFVRHLSVASLQSYFRHQLPLLSDLDFSTSRTQVIEQINQRLSQLTPDMQAKFHTDVERITYMTDDVGQAALMRLTYYATRLEKLPAGIERSCWMYVHHPHHFRQVEDIRYADHYRYGRNWTGYQVGLRLAINHNQATWKILRQNCVLFLL